MRFADQTIALFANDEDPARLRAAIRSEGGSTIELEESEVLDGLDGASAAFVAAERLNSDTVLAEAQQRALPILLYYRDPPSPWPEGVLGLVERRRRR